MKVSCNEGVASHVGPESCGDDRKIVVEALTGGTERINALIAQSDGTIVVGGVKGNDFAIVKFKSDWTLDPSFGTSSGYTDTPMSGSGAYALARQADGKFVAAGESGNSLGVARFTAGGILDTTFDTDGKVTATFFDGVSFDLSYAYSLAIGPDYRITAAGYKDNSGTTGYDDFALARFKVASGLEERIYAQTDANHNVTSLSNVFGSVQERFVYDPYGAATVLTSGWSTTSDSLSWVYRDQGLRYHSANNSEDERNRIKLVGLGRAAQADPSGYPDGPNRYQDRGSNPISLIDPYGTSASSTQPSATGPSKPHEIQWGIIIAKMNQEISHLGSILKKLDAADWKTRNECATKDLPALSDSDRDMLRTIADNADVKKALGLTDDGEVWTRLDVEIGRRLSLIEGNVALLQKRLAEIEKKQAELDPCPGKNSMIREMGAIKNALERMRLFRQRLQDIDDGRA